MPRSTRLRLRTTLVALLTAVLAASSSGSAALADASEAEHHYTTLFVPLGGSQVNGALYRQDDPGPRASVGVIMMHPNNNFQDALACHELADRGFTALCVSSRYNNTNRETMVWEDLALDVAPAVRYLRHLDGVDKVVLLGHSGGGQLMPFYQNVARNGAQVCQDPVRIVKCGNELDDLPPADALILLDAHHGYAANTLTSLDASVAEESRPDSVRPALDMYSARNGYEPNDPRYTKVFHDRYLSAQAEREDRLTRAARSAQADVAEGRGQFPDAAQFPVFRTDARLWQCDVRLVSRTQGAYPVLRADGSARVEVAHTVRRPSCDPQSNASFEGGTVQYTAEAFLSSQAIRTTDAYDVTEDSIEGVEWESSNTSTPENIKGVPDPTLIMAMTGHYWMVSSEMFYERSPARDKTLAFVEGASHGFTPCTECETTPGQYGDTVKTTFDYVANWLDQR